MSQLKHSEENIQKVVDIVGDFYTFDSFYYGHKRTREVTKKFQMYQVQHCADKAVENVSEEDNSTLKVMMDTYQDCYKKLHEEYL